MKDLTKLCLTVLILLFIVSPAAGIDPRIIPQPHFQSWGKHLIQFEGGAKPASLFLAEGASAKEILATEWLKAESRQLSDGKTIFQNAMPPRMASPPLPGVYLINWGQESEFQKRVAGILDDEDKQVLSDSQKTGQGYVIRMSPEQGAIWLVGAAPQGVLYAAATLLQLMAQAGKGMSIAEAHIRDYPDFRYRAASDWLLFTEANRWAYDWGDGRAKYLERVKRKIDFCLRYKINTVLFDGFGWTAEKIPGYAHLMRDLNRYARDRGIKLTFSGYGAGNRSDLVQPGHNIGKMYLNRRSYPYGSVYQCLAADTLDSNMDEIFLPTLGTCRANDELMELKVDELEEFVRSVEPGALYIHYEDQGDFDPTQEAWRHRCFQCGRRWPNDDLKAKDGGAGALAYGYTKLLEAVLRVKNPDTGYDASKDCTVTMISPVYRLREESQQDWNNVLDLWETTVSLMPQHENLQIGFREIFFQASTGQRWVEAFRKRMESRGLISNAFLFFLGGSNGYINSFPFTATAVLNGHFKGAETIYNFSGGLHQEPLQVLNGAFGWNSTSPGYQSPQSYKEITHLWEALNVNRVMPEEIFGESGFLELVCQKIYGAEAGRFMKKYFTHFEEQPRTVHGLLLPDRSERIPGLVELFGALEQDSRHWEPSPRLPSIRLIHREQDQIRRGLASHEQETISFQEWHTRLAKVWELQSRVNKTAAGFVDSALASTDLVAGAREDVEYLRKCLQVGERFSRLLAAYHQLLAADPGAGRDNLLVSTRGEFQEMEKFLYRSFQFDTVCPLGGDQASWLEAARRLRNHLARLN